MKSLFDFARTWSALNLNDTEVGLFVGIFITMNVDVLEDTNKLRVEGLEQQILSNHSSQTSLLADVLSTVSVLESIISTHAQLVTWFRSRWNRILLDPLIAETFEFPLSSDDSVTIIEVDSE